MPWNPAALVCDLAGVRSFERRIHDIATGAELAEELQAQRLRGAA